jgi:hypothetical protein
MEEIFNLHGHRRHTRGSKMSENESSKSKGKRLEEKEKLEAELERSLAVAKVKAAHKQIEETEKLRKQPIAKSICKRINNFLMMTTTVVTTLSDRKFKNVQMNEKAVLILENSKKIYVSIRYDFQKNLDIGEEGMTKMFPVIEVRIDTADHASGDLIDISTQMIQMKSYCERLLV